MPRGRSSSPSRSAPAPARTPPPAQSRAPPPAAQRTPPPPVASTPAPAQGGGMLAGNIHTSYIFNFYLNCIKTNVLYIFYF